MYFFENVCVLGIKVYALILTYIYIEIYSNEYYCASLCMPACVTVNKVYTVAS